MSRTWKSPIELAEKLREKADAGAEARLAPATARLIAQLLENRLPINCPGSAWNVDLYAKGSCVLKLDREGNVEEVVAWARSAGVARAALGALTGTDARTSYEQRRGSWVEARIDPRLPPS